MHRAVRHRVPQGVDHGMNGRHRKWRHITDRLPFRVFRTFPGWTTKRRGKKGKIDGVAAIKIAFIPEQAPFDRRFSNDDIDVEETGREFVQNTFQITVGSTKEVLRLFHAKH